MGRPRKTQALDQAVLDAEAAQLRSEGKTFRQIAAIQHTSVSTASDRVGRAIAAVPVEAVNQLRRLELERLDEMYRVAWDQLHTDHVKVDHGRIVRDEEGNPIIDHSGKLAGIDRLLRIQERRARLLGLDAPSSLTVITEDTIDAEIRRLEEELATNAQAATVVVEAPPEKLRRLAELRRLTEAASTKASVARYPTPGALAKQLDDTTIETPALQLIDQHLCGIGTGEGDRLIISMPPQEGKSQRAARRFPTWQLLRDQECRIAIVSYEHRTARRWGRVVRDDLVSHGLLSIDPAVSAANEWQIAGHAGGVYTVGIGGALTGRPVDLLIIDDPIKDREQADSQTYRDLVWDWWTDVGVARLAPGAPVILILTRWHEDDLAGRLLKAADGDRWRVLNIPALADHDPERNESDPLGREPGVWLESARGRTTAQWEDIRVAVGSRTFTSLYQGRPSPESGDVLQRQWWRHYKTPLWSQQPDGTYVSEFDYVIQSWDMAFKDTKSSDFVVGQVWGKRGAEAFLLDQIHARLSFTATVTAVRRITARWPQAHLKLVEDKANGSAVIDTLRSQIGGIVPVTPHESKYARANAIAPYVEAGNVLLPDDEVALFDVGGLVDEAASFPNGAHDDQVDALSQALNRLLVGAVGGTLYFSDDDETAPTTAPDGTPLQPLLGATTFAGDTSTGLDAPDHDPDAPPPGSTKRSEFV